MSVFIIAEAGSIIMDQFQLQKLIDIASRSGADAIKFQTYKTENLVTSYAKIANYQKKISVKRNHNLKCKKI